MFEKLLERRSRRKEHERLIEREKLMFESTKIVLKDNFFESVVNPALESHDSFSHVFKDRKSIDNSLLVSVRAGHIHMLTVPFEKLSNSAKERCEPAIIVSVEEIFQERERQMEETQKIFEGLLGIKTVVISSGGEETREEMVARFKQENLYPAFYLHDVMKAMDLHYNGMLGTKGVEHYERTALYREEGEGVIEFWKAVNDLEPYNSSFPNEPPPPSHDKNNQKKNPLISFLPAFN